MPTIPLPNLAQPGSQQVRSIRELRVQAMEEEAALATYSETVLRTSLSSSTSR